MSKKRPTEEEQIQVLIEQYHIEIPKDWDTMSFEQKLEWIAHRVLLDSRTSTKHSDMKEEGWLSQFQLERRKRREVQSKYGSWDEIPPKPGVFSRPYNESDKSIDKKPKG